MEKEDEEKERKRKRNRKFLYPESPVIYLLPFPTPSKPFPDQVLVVGVSLSGIPVQATTIIDPVQKIESLGLGFDLSVEES